VRFIASTFLIAPSDCRSPPPRFRKSDDAFLGVADRCASMDHGECDGPDTSVTVVHAGVHALLLAGRTLRGELQPTRKSIT
jgi:hypothetical protein